ncbi:MAG: hypothetical protein JXR77_01380, partial [Lentisphaeria bacterium]|nr:hypothetical protein [Lentisphaeria bacterium]
MARSIVAAMAAAIVSAWTARAGEAEPSPVALPSPACDMPLGADDAGNPRAIFRDPVLAEAFEEMGFDFLMVHIYRGALTPSGLDVLDGINRWAARTGHDYIVNLENTVRPRGDHPELQRPGHFFQPTAEWLSRCQSSPYFRGVCYDE